MTSYQRRKVEIEYLREVAKRFKGRCFELAEQIGKLGGKVGLSARPINGDDFLMPYFDSAEFDLELALRAEAAKK